MIPSHFLSITQRCLCGWNAFCPSSAEYVFNQVSIPDPIFFHFKHLLHINATVDITRQQYLHLNRTSTNTITFSPYNWWCRREEDDNDIFSRQ